MFFSLRSAHIYKYMFICICVYICLYVYICLRAAQVPRGLFNPSQDIESKRSFIFLCVFLEGMGEKSESKNLFTKKIAGIFFSQIAHSLIRRVKTKSKIK